MSDNDPVCVRRVNETLHADDPRITAEDKQHLENGGYLVQPYEVPGVPVKGLAIMAGAEGKFQMIVVTPVNARALAAELVQFAAEDEAGLNG
jgi:hypothetical protein